MTKPPKSPPAEWLVLQDRVNYLVKLNDKDATRRVNEIARRHGLDPADPSALKRLVLMLADVEKFDPRQKWDEITLGRMLVAYATLVKRLPHKKAVHELASFYPDYAESRIRRLLMDAFKMKIRPFEEKLARVTKHAAGRRHGCVVKR